MLDNTKSDNTESDPTSSSASHKRVDESWKDEVDKERDKLREVWGEPKPRATPKPVGGAKAGASDAVGAEAEESGQASGQASHQPEPENTPFIQFLMGLRMQALMSLGEIPHPVTQQAEVQPDQAQYVIETLALLQEKTKGNLSAYEAELYEQLMYELRMKFVQLMQPPPHEETKQ